MELLNLISLTTLTALPITLFVPLVLYILNAVALMKISKKLQIKGGRLAFVPLLNLYQMGKIAEQDQIRKHPEKKGKKWRHITLSLGVWLCIVSLIALAGMAVLGYFTGKAGVQGDRNTLIAGSFGLVLAGVLLYLIILCLVAALCVVLWIDLYKIYHVMADDHAPWMMVLSIFLAGSSLVILLVLAFCKKFPKSPAVVLEEPEKDGQEALAQECTEQRKAEEPIEEMNGAEETVEEKREAEEVSREEQSE